MEWFGALFFLALCWGVGFSLRRAQLPPVRSTATPKERTALPGLTPEQFRSDALPLVIDAWQRGCFCHNAGFRRMTTLDIAPNALADAQILIHHIVEQRFVPDGRWMSASGQQSRSFHCPQCDANCVVISEDFSISMHRSYVRWLSTRPTIEAKAPYLVGFYGFDPPSHVDGFQRVTSPAEFVAELVRTGP